MTGFATLTDLCAIGWAVFHCAFVHTVARQAFLLERPCAALMGGGEEVGLFIPSHLAEKAFDGDLVLLQPSFPPP